MVSTIATGSLGCKNPIRPVHCGFVCDPAHPGDLAPVGFLTSFFAVFVAKLGIFLALNTSLFGYSARCPVSLFDRFINFVFLYSTGS